MAQIAVIDKCDLCEAEENVDFFCVECDEILCSGCKVGHAKSKATRNHKIIPLSQARDENIVHKSTPVFCHEHSTVEISLFCLKCNELICIQCLAGKHKGHNVRLISPDEIRDSKAEELNKNITKLKEKQVGYEKAIYIEGEIHSQFTKSIEQARKDISDQKAKIIEELDIVCKEQNAELTKLQQNEDKRYSDKCSEIQAQNETVTSAIQTAEKSIESSSTALIMEATVETTNILDGLEDITMTKATVTKYQPGDRSRPTIHEVQGKVNIEQATTTHQPGDRSRPSIHEVQGKVNIEQATSTHQHSNRSYPAIPHILTEQQGVKPKLRTNVLKVNLQEKETSDSGKQHVINQPSIDISKVRVRFTLKVNGKGSIHVIVPMKNKTAWVKAHAETRLSLVDCNGKILATSLTLLGKIICYAKEYSDGLLITYKDHCDVIKMSVDGQSISTFSNLSPYWTKGFCVTQDMKVLVCLQSPEDKNNNKVVRLNSEGGIIQTIQYDATGAPLFNDPWRVTSLTTGEVIVVNWSRPMRIIGVDSQGQYLFTWEGEVQERRFDQYNVFDITHDSNNNVFVTDIQNNRVCVLGKDGSGVKCLLDSTQGIFGPTQVVVDNDGQLWVGCKKGKIHIIEL